MKFTKILGTVARLCFLISVETSLVSGQFVERPQISNMIVNAYWEANGAKNIDIMGTQRLAVNITQKSTVESSAYIAVIGLSDYRSTETLAPGATETIFIPISNHGEEQQVNNVPITVVASDAYTGEQTSNSTVTCNLLANLGPSTTLNIQVQDSSNRPIVGLQLQVLYPALTPETNTTQFTDTNGKATVNLVTPNGGGYTGQIAIQTDETAKYDSSNMTLYVNSGQNDATVNVPTNPAFTPSPTPVTKAVDSQLIIEVIAFLGFLVFLTVIAFVYVRSKNKRAFPPPP